MGAQNDFRKGVQSQTIYARKQHTQKRREIKLLCVEGVLGFHRDDSEAFRPSSAPPDDPNGSYFDQRGEREQGRSGA